MGNLLPGKEAKINFVVVQDVQIVGGAFAYILPQSYFPDYEKHPARYGKENKLNYKFNYSFKILSAEQITYISAPESVTTQTNPEKTEALAYGNKL